MNFQGLNSLNIFMNKFSGNFLPVTNEKKELTVLLKIYLLIVWLTQLTYLATCIFGLFHVPSERVLKDSTINMIVSVEAIILIIYLSNRKSLLRALIGKLNYVLLVEDEVLQKAVISTTRPLEKPLRIYTIASISSVVIWTSLPFFEVFRKSEFYYTDYRVPAGLFEEPFTVGIFISGVFLQIFGSGYTITRKVSLDLYTMHLILLVTAQYKYLRIKFAAIFQQQSSKQQNSNDMIKRKLRLLTYHYGTII
ncbi:uncharacterized protein LOC108632555, partial [Ceratina calcarata]|uniref:Uncharacterized protein LOC108624813 n=1 Tax=Ceratina calcarata TaxID=156304 RepID=A0AAJ7IYM7_9HYME